MHDLPHHYRVAAQSSAASPIVHLTSPGLTDIESASPAEFDGPGDHWSPETMLAAAVGDCFILTFRAVAAASNFSWNELQCSVEGTLDKVDRTMRFKEFQLQARLLIGAGADADRARRLLEKAERNCIIANSLAAPVHTEIEVVVG